MEHSTKKNNKLTSGRKKIFPVLLGIFVVLGGGYGINRFIYSMHHENTDDAQVEININPVVSKVQGYVSKLLVRDNQYVKKGDTLLLIDDRDYVLKVMEAEAALENAKANLEGAVSNLNVSQLNNKAAGSNVNTSEANIQAAEVRVWKATQDYKRYKALLDDHAVTQQQFDQVLAEKQSAEKQLDVLRNQKSTAIQQELLSNAQSKVSDQNIHVAQSIVKQKEALLEQAKLQLSYTIILAPENGFVTRKTIQEGQLIQAGQSMFAIAQNNEIWVTANFKETQLEKMKPGQEVEVDIDAFPAHVFHGRIESISATTGAKMALLPPDNASGNFVKVVQRVPVKIVFDQKDEDVKNLRAGMNAYVEVNLN